MAAKKSDTPAVIVSSSDSSLVTPDPDPATPDEEVTNDVIPPMVSQVPPYMDPSGATQSPVDIGEDVEFHPACPGAAGAKPVLTDIQAQLNENQAAKLEGREPLAVRIRCLMCGLFHKEQQSDRTKLLSMDEFGYSNIQIPAEGPPQASEFDMAQAVAAINGSPVNETSNDSGSTDSGESGSGTDSGSTESN